MKKKIGKIIAVAASVAIGAGVCCLATGCSFAGYESKKLNLLASSFALSLLGNDTYSWNVMSVNPAQSYGYTQSDESSWYGYHSMSKADVKETLEAFRYFDTQLKRVNATALSGADLLTYRSMRYEIDVYLEYYGSPYAVDFSLIGGDYITSEGGYVADFTSCVANYNFREERDVENLLDIVRSTKDVFPTYLDYAADRVKAHYPLYDYTLFSMQEYLDGITELGEDYYLYQYIERKIDGASFLSDAEKTEYKHTYKKALTDDFMAGVSELSEGLDEYKGHVEVTDKAYLAEYGKAGKAYFEWELHRKTGMFDLDVYKVYNELVDAYRKYIDEYSAFAAKIDELETTDKSTFDEYNSLVSGETKLLGLEEPEEILEYLKEAAKSVVPDLKEQPDIEFGYMDETVGSITSTMAYYLLSPLDELGSTEYITINPCYFDGSKEPKDIFSTIAHEGYPGHLYAHANQKEIGISLMTCLANGVSTYSEGWAVYASLAIMDHVAATTDSEAVRLYCENNFYDVMLGYIGTELYDIQVNYIGVGVSDFLADLSPDATEEERAEEEAIARMRVELLMEMPAVYFSYGYGSYFMVNLHDDVKAELGELYDEAEFNGVLLSEGSNPTLIRALALADKYITDKTA